MCSVLFNTSLNPVNVPLLFIWWWGCGNCFWGNITRISIMCVRANSQRDGLQDTFWSSAVKVKVDFGKTLKRVFIRNIWNNWTEILHGVIYRKLIAENWLMWLLHRPLFRLRGVTLLIIGVWHQRSLPFLSIKVNLKCQHVHLKWQVNRGYVAR